MYINGPKDTIKQEHNDNETLIFEFKDEFVL